MSAAAQADALLKKHSALVARDHRQSTCGVKISERTTLIEALLAKPITVAAVLRILKAEGISMSESTLLRHRNGGCKCH